MKKRLLNLSFILMAVFSPLAVATAQNVTQDLKVRPGALKMTAGERAKADKDFQANYPLLAKRKFLSQRHSLFPNASLPITGPAFRANGSHALFADAGSSIWVNLSKKSGDGFGYYSIHPTNPINFDFLYDASLEYPASNGVQYKDGHIYFVNLDLSYIGQGYVFEELFDIDTATGETTSEMLSPLTDIMLAATETAQADDGTVYGQFYDENGLDYEWGVVDYSTEDRTTIGPSTHAYVALGITKAGQLYGVASDGNLYKVDKTTGTETLVGATGLTLEKSDGSYYNQTGEIDQADDTFYWAATDADGNNGLYEVNLQTGAATKIADSSDEMYGMIIPVRESTADAPARATDLTADFAGVSLSGTISFTAPQKSNSGSSLSGNLTYTVRANDAVVATGTTTAGARVTAQVTVPVNGNYNFTVTTSNSAGESEKAALLHWVGYDEPMSVYSLTLDKDGNNAKLSWSAPRGGVHNGIIGPLTYDVYRIAGGDTTRIAADLTATNYTDDLSQMPVGRYSYGVKAKAEGLESRFAFTGSVVLGDAIEPDWTDEFNVQSDFSLFKVVDANHDGKTWSYNAYEQAARSWYSDDNGNDDWLFTPAIHLAPGRNYAVSFKVRNSSANYKNSIEVKWGTDTTAEAMTNTLLATTTPDRYYTAYHYEISVPADGKYYIGFHDNTATAGQFCLYVDSIVVENGAKATAPDSVTSLKVIPGDAGRMSATVSFKAPLKAIDGSAIAKVDSIQIKRDGELITTLGSYAAGASVTYTDNTVAVNGTHAYEITPFIAGDYGRKATAYVFIGQDLPGVPKNVTLSDFNGTDNIGVSWTPFADEGVNGGYLNPQHVSVSLFKIDDSGYTPVVGDSITTSALGASSVNINQNPDQSTEADGTTQSLFRVAARANGDAGQSGYTSSRAIVVGPPVYLPFKESLRGGDIDNGFAWVDGNAQWANNSEAANWRVVTDNSSDGDGGSLLWEAYTEDGYYGSTEYTISDGDEASINMPKVSLRGSTHPVLYFSLYSKRYDRADLKILVQTPGGNVDTLKTISLNGASKEGWTTQKVDLSQYVSQRYIIVKFHGVAHDIDASIGIDNINIFDQLEYNFAATGIVAPNHITAGKTAKLKVTVENLGEYTANGYKVVVYANNQPADTVSVSKQLPVLTSDTVAIDLPVAINQWDNLNVYAAVVADNDLDEEDNLTETVTIKVSPSQYTSVSDLTAWQSGNHVALRWTKPAKPAPVSTTEDFESYDPFATELGDWTLVDGDGGLAGAFFRGLPYPGQGTAFAFDAFNPDAIQDGVTRINPGMKPHSGRQYAGAPYVTNSIGSEMVAADNWIISPELPGSGQTIDFYALNIAYRGTDGLVCYKEKFDVLYSTTNTDTTSFVKLESDVADGQNEITEGVNWKHFSVELPAGAKYFAIHHNSSDTDNFLFGLDDISFIKNAAGVNDSIVGYNIYRDGRLIGTVNGDVFTFSDGSVDIGRHLYNVTVIYQSAAGDRNESGFSNDASIFIVTGIDAIRANASGLYDVYTIDGRTVELGARSLGSLPSGLYIVNGQKLLVK